MKRETLAVLLGYMKSQRQTMEEILRKIENTEPYNEEKTVYLAWLLHNLYCAFEDLFKEVAKAFENKLEDTSKYHRELLRRMSIEIPFIRPVVISKESFEVLDELRAFRHHLFRHAYNLELDAEKIKSLKYKVLSVFRKLQEDLFTFEKYLKTIEKLMKWLENTENYDEEKAIYLAYLEYSLFYNIHRAFEYLFKFKQLALAQAVKSFSMYHREIFKIMSIEIPSKKLPVTFKENFKILDELGAFNNLLRHSEIFKILVTENPFAKLTVIFKENLKILDELRSSNNIFSYFCTLGLNNGKFNKLKDTILYGFIKEQNKPNKFGNYLKGNNHKRFIIMKNGNSHC